MSENKKKVQMYPFLFEHITGTPIEGSELTRPCSHYIVMLATGITGRFYDERWMDNPHVRSLRTDKDLIVVPDPDLVDYEKHLWKFDSPDSHKNYREAMLKMKELWANLEIPVASYTGYEEDQFFRELVSWNSGHNQDYLIEQIDKSRLSDRARLALEQIYDSSSLDERWMIAHRFLGDTEEAAKIQAWLDRKKGSQK